ncbi:CAP domain-containing protein, partial [Escherichia coli]
APVAAEKPAAPAGNYEAQVADLVNKERAAAGLVPLKYNAALAKVANAKAVDMRDKNYFSHTSPTYGSPFDMMKSFGIRYTAAGENIAKGYMNPTS